MAWQKGEIPKFWDWKRDGDENDSKVLAVGFNYYIKEHNAKIMFELLSIKNEANARLFLLGDEEAGKDKKALTVAFQIQI